jgi:hypothetical protein
MTNLYSPPGNVLANDKDETYFVFLELIMLEMSMVCDDIDFHVV